MDACSAVQGSGFISSTTGYVDCQAQILGNGIWAALSAPGSTLSVVLAGFLTIFIALIGYNLLLGSSLTVRGTTLAFVKIGAVFALATSWPAYRTIVYDLVTDGPSQLVSEVGPRAGVVGSDGTLLQRLDLADDALARLAVLGPGNIPNYDYSKVPPPPFAGFDAFALGGSKIIFSLSAVAGLTIVRVIAGLMLGLGPFFVAFLLFDATRGLFEGWVRVLAGTAIAAVAVSIILGLQLGFMEPWLSTVLARRMSGEPMPTMPTELFVVACLFAIAIVASIYASMRLAQAFRLPALLRVEPAAASVPAVWPAERSVSNPRRAQAQEEAERSRATAIASTFRSVTRRDRDGVADPATVVSSWQVRTPNVRGSNEGARQAVPLGRSFNRRPGARVSALASRRDASA
jgi:type IV secretion system protein VirB6